MKVKQQLKSWREKSRIELTNDKLNLMKEGFNLRMQKVSRDFKHHHHFTRIRRDIARISTILSEKFRAGL
jgi:large subunit ribosomal protein L29